MLFSFKELRKYHVVTKDHAKIGVIHDLLFDRRYWEVHYLVIKTGKCLSGKFLIMPVTHLKLPDLNRKSFPVAYKLEWFKKNIVLKSNNSAYKNMFNKNATNCPAFFGWPVHFLHIPSIMSMTSMPLDNSGFLKEVKNEEKYEPELSMRKVIGYPIQVIDGKIGHLEDILVDDDMWTLHYYVVHKHFMGFGKKRLLPPHWLDHFDFCDIKFHINRSIKQIKRSPIFTTSRQINRELEVTAQETLKG